MTSHIATLEAMTDARIEDVRSTKRSPKTVRADELRAGMHIHVDGKLALVYYVRVDKKDPRIVTIGHKLGNRSANAWDLFETLTNAGVWS